MGRMCACFSMFGHAALSSAVRPLASSASHPHFDLNLPEPRVDPTVEPGGQQDDVPPCEGDPSASCSAAPRPPLPSAMGSPSLDQARFRLGLRDTVHVPMSPGAAPGTLRSYEAVLQSLATRPASKLDVGHNTIDYLRCFLRVLWRPIVARPKGGIRCYGAVDGSLESRKATGSCSVIPACCGRLPFGIRQSMVPANWGSSDWPEPCVRPRLAREYPSPPGEDDGGRVTGAASLRRLRRAAHWIAGPLSEWLGCPLVGCNGCPIGGVHGGGLLRDPPFARNCQAVRKRCQGRH